MRVQLEPAWLLNARPYGETSLLLEAFTERYGRIGLIAKGARGPKSKTRALLQPLQPLLLSWRRGGELGALTGVETGGPAPTLAGERLFYGWYVNELILRLLERDDPHPIAYRAYGEALAQLGGAEAEFRLRCFEKHLLADIGYGLGLPDDLDPSTFYAHDEALGFQPASQGMPGAALIALRDEVTVAGEAHAPALRSLMRGMIRRQLGGRELETPKLLREMRRGS